MDAAVPKSIYEPPRRALSVQELMRLLSEDEGLAPEARDRARAVAQGAAIEKRMP